MMTQFTVLKVLFVAVIMLSGLGCASAPKPEPVKANFADVNGIKMYYELHGKTEGIPLVLIHGGGSTINVTFSKIIPHLAKTRRVIAIEEQGHGRTSQREGKVTFEQTADDVSALLKQLKIEKADIFGFSNGASSGLQLAIRHPEQVRKLIFASSMTKRSGARPELWQFIKTANFSNMPQPLKDEFLKVNPDPALLRAMHDKDAERIKNFKDVPDKDLRKVKAQTLILFGDQDIIKPSHGEELTKLIPNSRLLILLGGHGDYMCELLTTTRESRWPELTAGIVEEFLTLPDAAK